jgi:hypothetical protein
LLLFNHVLFVLNDRQVYLEPKPKFRVEPQSIEHVQDLVVDKGLHLINPLPVIFQGTTRGYVTTIRRPRDFSDKHPHVNQVDISTSTYLEDADLGLLLLALLPYLRQRYWLVPHR